MYEITIILVVGALAVLVANLRLRSIVLSWMDVILGAGGIFAMFDEVDAYAATGNGPVFIVMAMLGVVLYSLVQLFEEVKH